MTESEASIEPVDEAGTLSAWTQRNCSFTPGDSERGLMAFPIRMHVPRRERTIGYSVGRVKRIDSICCLELGSVIASLMPHRHVDLLRAVVMPGRCRPVCILDLLIV